MRFFAFFAAALVCLSASAEAGDPGHWKPLLDRLELTPEEAQLAPGRWRGGGKHSLPFFEKLWGDWFLLEKKTVSTGREALKAAPGFRKLVTLGARTLIPGTKAFAEHDGALTGDSAVPFLDAIAAVHEVAGKPLGKKQREELKRRLDEVPGDILRAATVLLRAVPEAVDSRDAAFADLPTDSLVKSFAGADSFIRNYGVDAHKLQMMEDTNLEALLRGGATVAASLDRAATLLPEEVESEFSVGCDTPMGKVVLNGAGDQTYDSGSYLLIIDAGGADTYRGGAATASADHAVSMLLDVAGDDRYETDGNRAFGAGVLGYAFLWDREGDDTYSIEQVGLGTGSFGVGALMDCAGDDHYVARRVGQGAALYGVGVLSDLKGKDEYDCFQTSQGFAKVRGCGMLVDGAGNDVYTANDTQIDYPSPQTKDHNTSLAQGCAFGRRAHPGDGHSLAGGVGLLADGGGDDTYSCGLFGQGASYWYAVGMLLDVAGRDRYDGVWYVQGSSAHYGVAALCDLAGDDSYHNSHAQSQGQGHDYSIGLLSDHAGDDVYSGGGNRLGGGLWNGIGLFRDAAGNDRYEGHANFGDTGRCRPEHPCMGLFLDEGGKNEFPEGGPEPRSTWVRQKKKGRPKSRGAGMAK